MGILVLKNRDWWKPRKGKCIKLSSIRVFENKGLIEENGFVFSSDQERDVAIPCFIGVEG